MNKLSNRKKYKNIIYVVLCILFIGVAQSFDAFAQLVNRKVVTPPPSVMPSQKRGVSTDSIDVKFKVKNTIPTEYEDLKSSEYSIDLKTPSNIVCEAEYDAETGCYVVRTKVGDMEVSTPFILSNDEYNNLVFRQSMQDYYRQKNSMSTAEDNKKRSPFDFLDMKFGLGPLEKIFGPGGVQLKTQGSVTINMGIKSNSIDNPALAAHARKKTFFNFDQKIQASINASVGDKMKFNMNYNTGATFDFDTKNLKLGYEGKEDEIIKDIEAGNVSMTTGSSLIKGSTSLFGIKTKLQFGKLTATALVSQQNSETQTVSTKGGAQTTSFSVSADKYDQNRHFFLSHWFRDNYDKFASTLPIVNSGINITRIEVWVTNKKGNFNESRNLVTFMDLAEMDSISNHHWQPLIGGEHVPSNNSNNLLEEIKTQYPDARYINLVNSALEPLSSYDFTGGKDFEKVESARLLSPTEYTLNSTLGYISLKTALNSDEVIAVAYEYNYRGTTYQVGEFSGDITATDQSLYVKMLKSSTISTKLPIWHLMMKNVYSLGAYQLQKQNFKLNIKYLSDTTGTELTYLPVSKVKNKPLLQVLNMDRLDENNQPNPDGRYDYIEGYTVNSSTGRVIFTVVEPFGRYLEKQIDDKSISDNIVFKELYDSTQTVAQQMQDRNKFLLEGEYQASSGAQIKLNAMNVPQGSVTVTAGGVTLVENSDYTVDYNMGIVTILNQSIIDAGTNVNVTLENQSLFSTQRKTLIGLDLNYKFNKDFNLGATFMHYAEKSLTEKVSLGDESVNNSIWGVNFSFNKKFMWLTNLVNKIPTVNATAPSTINLTGEFAQLIPHKQKTGTNKGSSYIDDFESTQTTIDLRSPYSWFLSSTPFDSQNPMFPEAALTNNVDYGKNRALLSWYYIDRLFTQRNSSLAPGYIKNDLVQQSSPYVREISYNEVFPGRELSYGESSSIQTLNLSFYPKERGPYNLDATNIDKETGDLLNPEKRWGGIMRKMENTNFEQSNIEYIQFWLLNPFMDEKDKKSLGGDLYFNLGEVSEDILKDGMKSYENGLPIDGDTTSLATTVWGKVSRKTSLTYAFDTQSGARTLQDVGLNGLSTEDELSFSSYKKFTDELRQQLPDSTIIKMENDPFSPLRDPAGDNYHYYRGYDYDEARLSILERYKHYNGTEGNSLSATDAKEPLYQSSRSVPDVEDVNQDNTLNEYERYYQYRVSIRPEDLEIGKNYITDKQVATVTTRDGNKQEAEWIQFSIPLREYEKKVGSINDFTTIRFMRMFLTGFNETTHLRFATLELVRGEWRTYDYNLNQRGEAPADGELAVTKVNIEENAGRKPVNYVLPPGVSRIVDSGQSQITQLNEQSMQLKLTGLKAGDARAVYKNTGIDLRVYRRLQMFIHNEAFVDDQTNLRDGDVSAFLRIGTDAKNNYYEYEIPLNVTPEGEYNNNSQEDRYIVWPERNMLDCNLDIFTTVKKNRNANKMSGTEGVSYNTPYSEYDPEHAGNLVTVKGNPSLGDVRVIMIGVKNNSSVTKDCVVWVDELRVTDFNDEGGWAVKGNLTLGISDIATINAGIHKETAGFGAVDQGLSKRRLDDYSQYNVAVQVDMGRLLPEKVKLKAPIYYSVTNTKSTPKYNPLDKDVKLKDAIDACETKAQKDSIMAYALTRQTVESFSVSGLRFDVRSRKAMPWDPANFTFSYSSNKQRNVDPDNVYENTSDYRGSFQYSYTPYFKALKPFSRLKGKSKNAKFLKDWEFNWLPTQINFYTNMSRYYHEQQSRNEADVNVEMPISVSKNFLWDRQLSLTWNFTKSLSMTFSSNTTAHIEEPMGAVNKKLFPDKYRDWKDSVLISLKNLGKPYNYNQNFVATYKAPLNMLSFTDFMTATLSYNATYKWDRGATIDNVELGNTISNQAAANIDGRINLEQFYNKIPLLSKINKRFGDNRRQQSRTDVKPKRYSRVFKLKKDTTTIVRHNMKTAKVKITVTTTAGDMLNLKTRVVDENNIEILDKGDSNVKVTVLQILDTDKKNFFTEFRDYSLRAIMMVRNVNVRWRNTRSLTLPQFIPEIGDIFGQSRKYDVLSPGLAFAFGFTDESYIEKAKNKGWLLCDEMQTSPALYSQTNEFNIDVTLEPIKNLKINLTGNRTENRTNQIQFMYDDMNTIYAGTYTKTHIAIATSLRGLSAKNGYASKAFDQFLQNIPVIAERIEDKYRGKNYPKGGFLKNTGIEGQPYNPEKYGGVNHYSSDVMIPAFVAAYSGKNAKKSTLSPFPSLSQILPNWRVTYDGLVKIPLFKKLFKTFTLTHAYQCTYSVGSYSSYADWLTIGDGLGFSKNALTNNPVPTSPYNITSVTITEKFAPLIGVNATMKNNITFNVEYRDGRVLTLNSSAGQIVESQQKTFQIGAGYKIANFNTILKIKGKQQGVSNDLTLNLDFSISNNSALIRRIMEQTTQATSGTRTLVTNFIANYVLSKRITLGAYFDYQVNTPLVSSVSYPVTNYSYGLSVNLSLAK